jgi:hypothetical protein
MISTTRYILGSDILDVEGESIDSILIINDGLLLVKKGFWGFGVLGFRV